MDVTLYLKDQQEPTKFTNASYSESYNDFYRVYFEETRISYLFPVNEIYRVIETESIG